MTFREINDAIAALFDPETGAIDDNAVEELERLNVEFEEKVNSLINVIAEAKDNNAALTAEIKRLQDLKKSNDTRMESAKKFLRFVLNGNKFKNALHSVSYRKNESVKVDAEFVLWAMGNNDDLLRFKDPEPDLTAIKEAIKAGENVPYATIEVSESVIVR